jgi:hypothetical protein
VAAGQSCGLHRDPATSDQNPQVLQLAVGPNNLGRGNFQVMLCDVRRFVGLGASHNVEVLFKHCSDWPLPMPLSHGQPQDPSMNSSETPGSCQ